VVERGRGPSTADATRAYIDEHPSIRDALRDDLVNFAFLARKIQSERPLRNEEAIEIALRRYQQEMRSLTPALRSVQELLERSRLEVRSRVAILRIKEDGPILDRLYNIGKGLVPELKRRGVFQIFQGTRALTVLCEDDLLPVLLEEIPPKNVLHVERGLATVAFRSGPAVAETPGVLAVIAESLYQRGINCLETMSVHTDSILVFRESDLVGALAALSRLTAPEPGGTASGAKGSGSGSGRGPSGSGQA
jgi:hypothetical protein